MTRNPLMAPVVMLALALAGCGGGPENDPDDPTPDANRTASSSTAGAPSESAPATSDSTQSAPPAAGETLEVKGVRLKVPFAFDKVQNGSTLRQAAYPKGEVSSISIFRFPNLGQFTLAELGDESLKDKDWARGAKRLDDVVIDGEEVYHLAGPQKDGTYSEAFGAIIDDEEVQLSFVFDGEPASYRKDVIGSVLETVDFGEVSVVLPEAGLIPPAPARGPFIKLPQGRLRMPIYWVPTGFPLTNLDAAFPVGVFGTSISLITTPAAGVTDLDGLPAASGMDRGWKTPAERLDDVELDGQPALHQAGQVTPKKYVEQFAFLVGDQQLAVTFTFANDESPAYRDEMVASVLATIDVT